MKRRLLSVVLAATMVASLLAGCGLQSAAPAPAEAPAAAEPAAEEKAEEPAAEEKAEEPAIEVRSHTRQRKSGKARDILPENAKVVEETHTLSEEERICPECGEVIQPIGTEVQEKIQIIPAQIILHRDIYVTYACQNCKENNISTPILQTPKEPALIPGSYASAEAVAHFGVQKLSMGSPPNTWL